MRQNETKRNRKAERHRQQVLYRKAQTGEPEKVTDTERQNKRGKKRRGRKTV